MQTRTIRLSSPEIGSLWGVYIQETMSVCMSKHFLRHLQDQEIKVILQKALAISQAHVDWISQLFRDEEIQIPLGFSDNDVNLNAPALFHDPFPLSFVYEMSRMGMINFAFDTSSVARLDVRNFFIECLKQASELYNESTDLLLAKGIYDRPPMIEYPKEITMIENETSYVLGFIQHKRPLNALELSEIFLNIERNYFSILICMALLQVVKDKEIHNYIQEGKEISEKQINLFNDLLKKEDLLGSLPVTMLVTESTIPPFSDRLILSLFSMLNSVDIALIGHALGLSQRADLAAHYSKFIGEILIYAGKGFDMLVDRKWLEQPPQATNRKELTKK